MPKPAIGEDCTSCSTRTATDWPAASSTGASRCGGAIRISPGSAPSRMASVSSKTSVSSASKRYWPSPETPSW